MISYSPLISVNNGKDVCFTVIIGLRLCRLLHGHHLADTFHSAAMYVCVDMSNGLQTLLEVSTSVYLQTPSNYTPLYCTAKR